MHQLIDGFMIHEGNRSRSTLDERHFRAKRRKERCILNTNDSTANNHEAPGYLTEFPDRIARENDRRFFAGLVRTSRRKYRSCARCKQSECSGDGAIAVRTVDHDGVCINKGSKSPEDLHAIANQHGANELLFFMNHRRNTLKKLRHRHLCMINTNGLKGPLHSTPLKADDCFAKCLRRQCSQVHGHTADAALALDHGHALP